MKRTSTITLLTVALLSAATGVLAQEQVVKADVPFSFSAGSTSMPAGIYTVSSPSSGLVRISSADRQTVAAFVAIRSFQDDAGDCKLVFDRYGDKYFLHRVLCPSINGINLDIPPSRAERESHLREAKLQSDERILIAAR